MLHRSHCSALGRRRCRATHSIATSEPTRRRNPISCKKNPVARTSRPLPIPATSANNTIVVIGRRSGPLGSVSEEAFRPTAIAKCPRRTDRRTVGPTITINTVSTVKTIAPSKRTLEPVISSSQSGVGFHEIARFTSAYSPRDQRERTRKSLPPPVGRAVGTASRPTLPVRFSCEESR
jgi:hypothetical protein